MVNFYMEPDNFSFLAFMFDARSGILTRNGRHVPTPKQTYLLLKILLERAGTLVTREEIENLLWPDEKYIDHQLAINRAINNLRAVLGDNSQKSKFIKTFPKRGYCFIAPVTAVAAQADAANGSGNLPPQILLPETANSSPLAIGKVEPDFFGAIPDRSPPQAASSLWWRVSAAAAVVLLMTGATLAMLAHRAKPAAANIVMGVVPFEQQGDTADGLADSFRMDLIDTLSQLPSVQLRASHSLENIQHDDAHIRELAGRMHLDLLLMGKLTEHGKNCILQLELVRGRDAVHMASFQYFGSKDELATIRDRVQRDIFSSLAVTRRSIQAAHGSTENSDAYGTYLQARELAYNRTVESLAAAAKQYALAIHYDPGFARAYAGMATAYLANYGYSDANEDLLKARAAADRAVRLDPDLAEAHAVLGINAFRNEWNFTRAESELRRALQLEPHQAAYHGWLAELLVIEGRPDESLREIDAAHMDDPLWPQVYNIEVIVASEAQNVPRAIEAARKSLELSPGSPYAHDRLAWCLFYAKRYPEAIAEWHTMASMEKDEERMAMEDKGLAAYRQGGIAAYAAVRRDAATRSPTAAMSRHPNDFIPAEWYSFTHDSDDAIAELDKTVAHHDAGPLDLSLNPMFDSLHRDPRFVALLARVGLKLPHAYSQSSLQASLR